MFGRWRGDRLERSLRDQRPTPSDEFMARMSSEISRRPVRRGVARPVLALGLSTAMLAVFAGLGGIGYASSALSGVKSHVAPTNNKGVQGSAAVENSYPNRKFKVFVTPEHVKLDKPQSAQIGGDGSAEARILRAGHVHGEHQDQREALHGHAADGVPDHADLHAATDTVLHGEQPRGDRRGVPSDRALHR